MLPSLSKHMLITATLFASLTLTACGKSKDNNIVTPPTDVKAQANKDAKNGKDTNGQLGAELPDPNSDHLPPVPEPGPVKKTPTPPKADNKDTAKITPPPAPPAMPPIVKPEAPKQKVPGTVVDVNKLEVPESYNSANPQAVNTESVAKRFTGGVGENGLLYTSSSTDTLMSYLRARNSKVDAVSRKMNLAAAASVVSAKLSVDKSTQDVLVSLKIKEGSEVRNYALAGTRAEGESNRLLKVGTAGLPGVRDMQGTIKCLDLDGGCETTFVRLQIGSAGSSAIINVIFRDSLANIHVDFLKEQSSTYEFLVLKEFFVNSIKKVQHIDNKIKEARMSSYEVVNGKAEAVLSIEGLNNELIAFSAPLLSPEVGSSINVGMSRVASLSEMTDLMGSTPKLNYANSIASGRVLANNGLGQVKTVLKLRQGAQQAADQIVVTFARKIKPLVDLTDDNLK